MTTALKKDKLLAFIFSATLFLSASLMFSIQPMIGKMLLPIVGGTPAGWIVAMAFFQIMLLVGYFLAHFLSLFKPSVHGALFFVAICLGFAFLPVSIPAYPEGPMPGPFDIFLLLLKTVAIPFIAMSAASSTLQRLFTQTAHPQAQDPYFLYAVSNFGSFTGLFAYPFAIEPLMGLHNQGQLWLGGYTLLALFVFVCIMISRSQSITTAQKTDHVPTEKITSKQYLTWIALAFFPSSLLLGVTTHITTNIFPAPMMWVLPLGLYLLTFIIAFSKKNRFKIDNVSALQPGIMAITIAAVISDLTILNLSWFSLFFHLMVFTVTAMMCHMRLAALRPSGKHLTAFYLMLSIGGALGGVLNAFIAPVILNGPYEYPIILILTLLVNPIFKDPKIANTRYAFIGILLLLIGLKFMPHKDILVSERSFFGSLKVKEISVKDKQTGKTETARYLLHGTTIHGIQIKTSDMDKTPGSYYTNDGPVADIIDTYKPQDIAVVGLGVGSMNCYVPKGGHGLFVDIDPAIIKAADHYFTYLDECSPAGRPEIIIGDGRLAIERLDANRKFDLIALDAFTADSVPTHLLTVEAMAAYMKHLKKGGLLLFNISNRYAHLSPVLGRNAQELGLKSLVRYDLDPRENYAGELLFETESIWLIVTTQDTNTEKLDDKDWVEAVSTPDQKPWTDDYTNLAGTLMLFK